MKRRKRDAIHFGHFDSFDWLMVVILVALPIILVICNIIK